ncbi:MAG: Asp-tRNA(Asn)/Glu-tRNA(Gln) amidotransferase subunit GatA [bacterium]
MELSHLTIHKLHELLVKKEISSSEILDSIFEEIDKKENEINAYISLNRELAYRQAKEFDEKEKGERSSFLAGIPLAIKDNICLKDIKTTCGSKILSNYIPIYNATVIERLQQEKAILIGKTNLDEFAMGSSTETSFAGVTRNPVDINKIPGGSSGGSAAAVAANETIAALGSDTGGSIRQPASFCGVVGLKPTYGRVSRFGLVAFASSLDQIGPITKDVTDSAILLKAIAGYDPLDSTSINKGVEDYIRLLKDEIKGMIVGVPKEYFIEGLDPEVKERVNEAIKGIEDLGCRIEEISLPHTEYAIATYYIIAPAEASSNLARFDGVRYGYRTKKAKDLREMYEKTRADGFGAEVKRRIMLGTYVLSSGYYDAYYLKAQKVRTLIKKDFDKAFEKVQAIITPTSPVPAFGVGEKINDPLQMYLLDIFTISVNLAGLPAISVPCGFTKGKLPVGLQIIGKHFDEGSILRLAYHFEQSFLQRG